VKTFFVISGLPASGKTTVANIISQQFCLPLIDKDIILEALFDTLSDVERKRLSAASNEILKRLALSSNGAVLCSWWRHPELTTQSGTPSQWLNFEGNNIIEVFCNCPVDIAKERFIARVRHKGHKDKNEKRSMMFEQFVNTPLKPLGIGKLVKINTSEPVDELYLKHLLNTALQSYNKSLHETLTQSVANAKRS